MTLAAALSATWPAAQTASLGPFTLRRSPGGGARVIAATQDGTGPPDPSTLAQAIAMMRGWGQIPLFRVLRGQSGLDAMLAARSFVRCKPTVLYSGQPDMLAAPAPPRLATFEIWPPLAIQVEIWREAEIGDDRIAVMNRAAAPRTALFGRQDRHPAAAGFLAAHDGIAMLHALEVRPTLRRRGTARRLIAHAAAWADRQGCHTLALAVTEGNAPARALYDGLGMVQTGGYHYRDGGSADA